MRLPWRRKYSEFKLPTSEKLYENPVKQITIEPKWYGLQGDVLDFIEQICEGYLWEIKFGTAFIAQHDERREVERIQYGIQSIRHRENKGRWVPNMDEELALLMVDFARVVPKMWD